VNNESHVGVFGFATTFRALNGQTGKFDFIVPYVSLAAKGLVFDLTRERYVAGIADPAFRFSTNLIGAPALTAAEFKDYRQDFILGATLAVPVNRYHSVKVYGITGYNARREHDFRAVGIAWQVRWGRRLLNTSPTRPRFCLPSRVIASIQRTV
jgi:hypothetical protein